MIEDLIPGEINILSLGFGWIQQDKAEGGFNVSPKVLSEIYFDVKSKRYKWTDTSKFVSKVSVNAIIDRKIELKKAELIGYSQRITSREIGVYKEMTGTLKDLHILQAARAKGFENITERDLGIIGNQLKKQYYAGVDPLTGNKYGLKFLIKDAPESSIAQIENRLRMFGESSAIIADLFKEDSAKTEGLTSSWRSLGKAHNHCEDCLRYAAMGIQPIGVLPLPRTQCQCLANCVCSISYK
jgi:hypothetical protein